MKFADRLKFTAAGASAASITVGAAVTACRTLAQAISDGALAVGDTGVPFTVTDGTAWEDSLFTITSTTQLTRTSVLASSAGGTTAATFSGPLTVFNAVPASHLSTLLSSSQGVAASALTTITSGASLNNADTVLGSQDGGNTFVNMTIAAIAAKVAAINGTGTGGTTETLTVGTIATPQTVGTAFNVSGTWTGVQPTALDFAIADNGGTQGAWNNAVTSLVINSNGTWSFSVTPTTSSTSRTMQVRDHNNTSVVSAASNAYVVNAATAGNPAPYQFRTTNASGQKINGVSYFPDGTSSNKTMTQNGLDYYTRDSNTSVSVVKADGATYPPDAVRFVWSKSSTQCPIVYTDTAAPAVESNGSTTTYADGTALVNLIYGNTYNVPIFLHGTPGTYYLWALTSDGWVGVYDNATGTPIGWTTV